MSEADSAEAPRQVVITEHLVYALDVPAKKSEAIEGSEPRYACCHHTEAQGHSMMCSTARRASYIEDTLQQAGIRFVRVTEEEARCWPRETALAALPGEDTRAYEERTGTTPPDDPVNHPKHYNEHPAGIECIDVIEHMTCNVGNAVKYLWRAGHKPGVNSDEDLRKAVWYIERERRRLAEIGR